MQADLCILLFAFKTKTDAVIIQVIFDLHSYNLMGSKAISILDRQKLIFFFLNQNIHRRHCVVVLEQDIHPSLVLVQPRKNRPYITESLLMGRKEMNQTNKYTKHDKIDE